MEIGSFHAGVPGGIEGRPERIIIVGAGLAGLTAANALVRAGVDTVVLEARDRIGGRLHTVRLGGGYVDIGGSWIHEPDGNPLARWADELGVAHRPANLLANAAVWHPSTGVIRGRRAEIIRAAVDSTLFDVRGELVSELGSDAAMDRVVEACLARVAASGDPRDIALVHALLLTFVEQDGGARASDVALGGFPAATLEYGGDYLGDMPAGGYEALVAPLAAGLDIRLGRQVTAIGVSAAGVRVTDRAGASEEGSHALVTVPLGVLQSGTLTFDPAIPDPRAEVIARLGVGRFEKLALRFEQPFWTSSDIPNLILLSSDGRSVPAAFVGLDHVFGMPILVALAFGSSVETISSGSEVEAVERMVGLLREALGPDVPEPTSFIRTSWTKDPFARGAYSYVPRGISRSDLDELGRPLWGRLMFAGEATTSARVGYADGAMTTGAREAMRLLARSSVEIGPLD